MVKGKSQFDAMMKDRKEKIARKQMNNTAISQDIPAEHFKAANALLGILNQIKMDNRLKEVLRMRLIGPLMTGQERSYLSIALEIGTSEKEIIEMEAAGLEILDGYIQRFSTEEFKDRYNKDKTIRDILKKG